jgi:signal transduction histidine kinase
MKNWTIRARLTLLYGGLFFIAGALVLVVTYFLVGQSLESSGPGGGRDFASTFPDTASLGLDRQQILDAIQQIRAEQERLRSETMNTLVTRGGIAVLAAGIVASSFGWLVAGQVLRPLDKITETAQRIAGADGVGRGLHERIALPGPLDEVKRLADTFDQMLERLDRSFDGQRRFVANASHELRTPLALNRALVEVAVTRPGAPEETKQLGESLLAVNERHERLIDGLLTLADAENQITEWSPVDLAEVAGHILTQTAAPGVKVSRDLRPARTTGDPILLERLTQNLVENAVRHNVPDGQVTVTTTTEATTVVLTVENTGPTVPAYEIESLFQPFRRLRHERVDGGRGFGLGLSIVRAVARAHGGDARAVPREGGGLAVAVTIPIWSTTRT